MKTATVESVMNFPLSLKKKSRTFFSFLHRNARTILLTVICVTSLSVFFALWWKTNEEQTRLNTQLSMENGGLSQKLEETMSRLTFLENEDQKVRNDQLEAGLKDLQKVNSEAVLQYERILSVQEDGAKIDAVGEKWAQVLFQIGKNDYASASALLIEVKKNITDIEEKLVEEAALKIPNVAVNNQAPAAGFQQQKVETSAGTFAVSLVAGDMGSTKVIVDTASSTDCQNDCPVLALGDYVARNGAFAGINGSYFCPASYPSCADKKNSYDLLVMNKDKVYFNSENNVYSSNPAVIFQGGSMRFVSAASEWGRDTGIDSMLSNYPLLVSGSEVRFGGDGDPKKGSKGSRSFVANKGSTAYIGVVHGATVAEAAIALKTLGMENALNLDSGGSTALWAGGYKVGPGRAIPNAILFVKK